MTILLLAFVVLSTVTEVFAHHNEREIVLGIPDIFISGTVNPQDARAGLKVWLNELATISPLYDTVSPLHVNNYDEIDRALAADKIDFIFLPTPYYMKMKDRYYLEPAAVAVGSSGYAQHYLILTSSGSGFNSINDLKGSQLSIVLNREHGIVGREWLNIYLNKHGQSDPDNFFSQITDVPKQSDIIIQLFFNNIKAGLVTRFAYDTMVELNPQIAKKVHILASSPEILSHVMCFTRRIDEVGKKTVLDTALKIQEFPRGKQIALLFQLSKLILYKEEFLDSAKKLFCNKKTSVVK